MESARNNDGGGGVNARRTGPLRPPLGTGDAATAAAVSSSSSDSDPQLSPSATTPDSAFAVSSSSSSTPSTSPSALLPVVGSDAMAFGDTAIGLFDESGVLDVLTDLGFLDALDRDEGSASLLLASQNGLDVDGSSCDADVRVGEKKHMSTSFSARGVPVSASEPQDRKKRGQTAGQLKRIRKCVKRELEYLQVQVHDLEEQLAVLRRTRAATAVDSVDPTTATMAPVAQPGGMWERIARNQLHEKKESEEENAKLRELLERQIKVANALARVLKKSPDVSWLESSGIGPLHKRSRIHDAAKSTAEDIYETLSRSVNSLYAQLDTVFANWAVDTRAEISDVQVKSDANGSTFLEFFSSKVFPLDLATTSAAAWKLAGLSLGKLPNGHYGATEATGDMVRSHASGTLRIQQAEVGTHCNMVIKKLEQEDRVVILWYVVGRSEVSSIPTPKFTIRESGWLVIRELHQNLEVAQVSESPKSSVMQSVVHVRPEFVTNAGGESCRGDFPPGVLTDVIMGSHLQSINATYQKIENVLVVDGVIGNEASV